MSLGNLQPFISQCALQGFYVLNSLVHGCICLYNLWHTIRIFLSRFILFFIPAFILSKSSGTRRGYRASKSWIELVFFFFFFPWITTALKTKSFSFPSFPLSIALVFSCFFESLREKRQVVKYLRIKGLHQEAFLNLGDFRYPKQMHDCSSRLDGCQPGSRAWAISQGFIQRLSLLPLLLFPLSRTPLNATTKAKNATHGFPREGLVILHLALAGRGVLRTSSILSPKAECFITVWTWSCSLTPDVYSCSWAIQLKLFRFYHLLCCILCLKFFTSKWYEKLNSSKFLDTLTMNFEKDITLKKTHVTQNRFDHLLDLG